MEFNMLDRHDRDIFANLVYMLQNNGIRFELFRSNKNEQTETEDHITVVVREM